MSDPARTPETLARLSALIPAFYRAADATAAGGAGDRGPLLQLLEVLARQAALVEEDIAQLYDNWFIETCADWVVPYIGALVGAPPLPGADAQGQRRFVAHTLGYRRRKGTARVLEQLAFDVTGWPALATEAFRGLALNQSLLQVRPGFGGTADLRDATVAEAAGTPFDRFAHLIDIRSPGDNGARWNVPVVPIYLWRLATARLNGVEATPDPAVPWLFHADPWLGAKPWANIATPDSSFDQLAAEPDLPVLLRRRPLADELRARRLAAPGQPLRADYFALKADEASVFDIALQPLSDGPWQSVPPEALRIVNLSGDAAALPRPDATIPARDGGGVATLLVDPKAGRVAVPAGDPIPAAIRISHALGYAAGIGAGPFDRNDALAALLDAHAPATGGPKIDWQAGVMKDRASAPADRLFATLDEAVAAWMALPAEPRRGLIVIEDSAIHALPAGFTIRLREDETLIVTAARWRLSPADPTPLPDGQYDASGLRPHLVGELHVRATGGSASLFLDGLSHGGALIVDPGTLGTLGISNCTLDLDGGLRVQANTEVAITISASMTGPIRLSDIIPQLTIAASIVHGGPGGPAIGARGALVELDGVTILGAPVRVRELHASNSLFAGRVTVDRVQTGCVRFSHLPAGSRTPRRYRCQPDTAVAMGADPARVVPQFVSRDRASPWYAQLHPLAHEALRRGADDGGEIGAFRAPSSALGEANARAAIGDDLRVGLEAGLFPVT